MPKPTDTTLHRPLARKFGANKPGNRNFRIQARRRLDAITTAQDSVQYAYELFGGEEDIWPDQCDCAIDSIQTIIKPVQDFCTLLDKATEIPVPVVQLRHDLLMKLYGIKEQ